MDRTSKTVLGEMMEVMAAINEDVEKWADKNNKSAAARIRKATLNFEKLGKEFRKLSVKE
mgnify:CR=1 FL=1